MSCFLAGVLAANEMRDAVYAEPYAGGAGAALSLLFSEKVSRIVLNDKDRCIYAFWRAVLNQTGDFLDLIERTPLTVDEWHRQRAIYEKPWRHGQLAVGFATFYLNRCNRSGIIGGSGPIGGFDQTGNYKIDARFNRANLRDRVDRIATYRDRIEFHRLDALDFLRTIVRPITRRAVPCLVFLDPPYYAKGPKLYLNAYRHGDHAALARFLSRARFFNWVLTYDNVEEIRQLYQATDRRTFAVPYSVYEAKRGEELLIHDPRIVLPAELPVCSACA